MGFLTDFLDRGFRRRQTEMPQEMAQEAPQIGGWGGIQQMQPQLMEAMQAPQPAPSFAMPNLATAMQNFTPPANGWGNNMMSSLQQATQPPPAASEFSDPYEAEKQARLGNRGGGFGEQMKQSLAGPAPAPAFKAMAPAPMKASIKAAKPMAIQQREKANRYSGWGGV